MLDFETFPLIVLLLVFAASACVIAFAGTKLAATAEGIAAQTGWGQAIVGAVFIGISTSLAGTVLSFYAAGSGHASLAISNSVGGIAAQTAFLAIADLTYRRINLEHAAASLENLAQGALLIVLLSIPIIAMAAPEVTVLQIHPVSVVLIGAYLAGLKVVNDTKSNPMWRPRKTYDTQVEKEEEKVDEDALRKLFIKFAVLAAALAFSGYLLAEAGVTLSERTGLSLSVVGGLFTSVTTSLPELITTLAAVRRGALNLAVGNIIGGNSFDVLFLSGADVFYREGSIYHAFENAHILIIGTAVLMTGVMMLGMLRRERIGPAGIGFESVLMLTLYGLFILCLFIS